MGSCHSDTTVENLSTNMETTSNNPQTNSPAARISEIWDEITPLKRLIAEELFSRLFGEIQLFVPSSSLLVRSSSESSSCSSSNSSSPSFTSSNSSSRSSLSSRRRSRAAKPVCCGSKDKLFVKIVSIILNSPIDGVMLQMCILGEMYSGYSLFLDAFIAALKSVLLSSNIRLPEEKVEQFLYLCGDMVELLRDDVRLRYGSQEDDVFEGIDMSELSDGDAYDDLDLFYDFWSANILRRSAEARMTRRISSMLFSSSPQLRNMFESKRRLQFKLLDPLMAVFRDENCEHLGSIYRNITSCQQVLSIKHFSQIGQAFILSLKAELGKVFTADQVLRFRRLYRIFLIPILIGFEQSYIQKRIKRRTLHSTRKCPKAQTAASLASLCTNGVLTPSCRS